MLRSGNLLLPKCNKNVRCINSNFTRIQSDYVRLPQPLRCSSRVCVKQVEKMKSLFPRHDSVNLLGTLQAAGKIPNASTGQRASMFSTPPDSSSLWHCGCAGHPNLDFYSPDQYMQSNWFA